MFPTQPAACWRCKNQEAHLPHIFWSCAKVKTFWDQIRTYLPRFTDQTLPDDLAFYLLHLNLLPTIVYKSSLLSHLLNAACSCIARSCIAGGWNQPTEPAVSQWLIKVNEIQGMEELAMLDMDAMDKFRQFWHYWIDFQNSQDYSANLTDPPL